MKYGIAWLLHNKILRTMSEREDAYVLCGKIQMDDAYLGGERPGGKAGRGSENKIPIVAAVSLNEAGHPIHAKIKPVSGFSPEAVGPWATENHAPRAGLLAPRGGRVKAISIVSCLAAAYAKQESAPQWLELSTDTAPQAASPQRRWLPGRSAAVG